jgi:uncharacterized protein YukE
MLLLQTTETLDTATSAITTISEYGAIGLSVLALFVLGGSIFAIYKLVGMLGEIQAKIGNRLTDMKADLDNGLANITEWEKEQKQRDRDRNETLTVITKAIETLKSHQIATDTEYLKLEKERMQIERARADTDRTIGNALSRLVDTIDIQNTRIESLDKQLKHGLSIVEATVKNEIGGVKQAITHNQNEVVKMTDTQKSEIRDMIKELQNLRNQLAETITRDELESIRTDITTINDKMDALGNKLDRLLNPIEKDKDDARNTD